MINKNFKDKNKHINNLLKQLKTDSPLVNCITNTVTINDCANIILAIGGSPMMADDPEEVEEFVEVADSLVINIGKMSQNQIKAMNLGSIYASESKTPIVLDPVGVGVSQLRNNLVIKLIEESNISAIRGNISEIKTIFNLFNDFKSDLNYSNDMVDQKSSKINSPRGVDVREEDIINENNLEKNGRLVKILSSILNSVIIASGPIDLISDGASVYACENGHAQMSLITGTGCMLSSLIGTFYGIRDSLESAMVSTMAMGIAGEKAAEYVKQRNSGIGTFRTKLIDYISLLDDKEILNKGKIYELKLK